MAGVSARDPSIAARQLCRMTDTEANRQCDGGIRYGSGTAIAALDGETYQREPISDPLPCCWASATPGPYVVPRGGGRQRDRGR